MSERHPGARLIDFAVEERHRAFVGGRRVLEVGGGGGAAWPSTGDERYEGAWVAPSGLGGIDLPALARRVAAALHPGAPVVCVVPSARPLVGLLREALRGTPRSSKHEGPGGTPAGDRVSLAGWKEAFGKSFRWRRARAIGLLVAPPPGEDGRDANPRALAALAVIEHLTGTWPVLRGLGERILLEGERR